MASSPADRESAPLLGNGRRSLNPSTSASGSLGSSLPKGNNKPTVVIQGETSWSRRREIQERIRRQAELSGVHVDDVVVTSSYGSTIPRNHSAVTLASTDDEDDPLAGVRVEMPYKKLLDQLDKKRQRNAAVIRLANHPFRDRRPRADAIQENNRHRYNLISRIVGPPLPLPRPGDVDAQNFTPGDLEYTERFLRYPDHLLPAEFFRIHFPHEEVSVDGKQSSLVTILAIWNTMMGTSLLSTPWAISQAGLLMGPLVALATALIAGYTAYRILYNRCIVEKYERIHEFSQLCGCVLGRGWEFVASFFSLTAVLGAAIVYWVLMTNFLYNGVTYLFEKYFIDNSTTTTNLIDNVTGSVYCPHPPRDDFSSGENSSSIEGISNSTFNKYWNPTTAPIFLIAILYPLICVKSVTFFTKLNSFGTITVLFLIGLVLYYANTWGINVELHDVNSPLYVPLFKWSFPCLTGMLSLGLFIHNSVITITRNNRYQENNTRDLSIAFSLVTFTYMIIGVLFYVSFPENKGCLEDNFLNNFHRNDPIAVFTRWLLFFQLFTVFPLIMYILRSQACLLFFDVKEPSFWNMTVFNVPVVFASVVVTVFFPNIGFIIRFSGSLCGFVLIFCLPNLVHLAVTKGEDIDNKVTPLNVVIHLSMVVIGFANFIAQFFI